jgi:hypothetical protein
MATSKGTRCLAVPSCFTFQCASSSSLEVRTPSSSSCSHAATVRIHTRQHRRTRAPVSLLAATAISPPWTDSVSWSMGYELGSPSFPFKNNSNSNIIPGIIHRSPCLCRVSIQKHCFFLGGFRGIGACSYWEEWIDGISSDTGANSEVLVPPWRGLREQEEQDHPLPSCHVQGFSSCGRPAQLHHRSSSIGQQVRRVSIQKHCFFGGVSRNRCLQLLGGVDIWHLV